MVSALFRQFQCKDFAFFVFGWHSVASRHPHALLCALGALTALCFAPWFLWPLFVPIYGCVFALCNDTPTLWRNFTYGLAFGLGMYLTNFYWLYGAILLFVETNLPASVAMQHVVSTSVSFAFLLSLALPLTLAFCVYWICRRWLPRLAKPWVFAVLVVLAELCRGAPFWPFLPWNMSGYGWAGNLALLQLASWLGVVGMSVLVIGLSAMCQTLRQTAASAAILLLLFAGGYMRLSSADPAEATPKKTIRMVQANHSQQATRSASGAMRVFIDYWDLSRMPAEKPLAMVLWPEGAAHFVLNNTPAALHKLADIPHQLVFGGIWQEPEAGHYNVTFLKDANSVDMTQMVKKQMVVPVAEDMPLKSFFSDIYRAAMPNFVYISPQQNQSSDAMLMTNLGKALVLNCYEAIFSRQVLRHSADADYIIHVTDDSWLGESTGRTQFFYISRMRAVEARKPLLRISNAGIDGQIDSFGRILHMRDEREFPAAWDIDVNMYGQQKREASLYVKLWQALFTDTRN